MILTPSSTLIKRVMRRVYAIWFLKKAVPVLVLEVSLLIFALTQFAKHVFVANVLRNIAASGTHPGPLTQFLFDAFVSASAIIELMIILGVIAVIALFWSIGVSIQKARASSDERNFIASPRVTNT